MKSINKKTVKRNKKTIKRNKKTVKRNKKTVRRSKKKLYKGGDIQRERLYSELTPEDSIIPFKSFGFNGASSASEAAYERSVTSAEQQHAMNKLSGGANVVEVPSFAPIGGIKLAYSSTDLSKDTNLTNLIGDTDATNDHWVYDDDHLVYDDIPKVNVTGGAKRAKSHAKRA